MSTGLFNPLYLGFTLGLVHALDPDHLVAVGTVVSEEHALRRSALLGAVWGLGHTTSLALVGLTVLTLRVAVPPMLAQGMEFGVALMIMLLGAALVWRSARTLIVHAHDHSHGDGDHAHVHVHDGQASDHEHHRFKSEQKAFTIGLVHGLAGSAALSLLVLATLPSLSMGLLYILVFGIGSTGAMLAMSTAMGVPFGLLAKRASPYHSQIQGLVGLLAVSFGLYFAWSLRQLP